VNPTVASQSCGRRSRQSPAARAYARLHRARRGARGRGPHDPRSALAEIDRAARALSGKAELEIRGPRNGFDDALFARIAARPEVAAASPIVELDAALASGGTLRVLGIDPCARPTAAGASCASRAPPARRTPPASLDGDSAWLSPRAASG
jgi:putative ABC transport system permease protein